MCPLSGTKTDLSPVQTVRRKCPELIFARILIQLWMMDIKMGTRLKLLKETATVTVLSLSAAHVYMMYNALAIRIIQTALLAAVMHIDLKLTGASGRGSVLIMMHHQVLILCNISNPMSSIFKT